MIPHLPPDVTALEQKLPVRWGHYQIFISTTGSRAHSITAVALNGKPLPLSHAGSGSSSFNRTVVVLEYDALPAPSAAAVSAMGSTELAIFDALTLNITFGAPTSENLRPAAAPPPPPLLHRSRLQRSQVNGPVMAGLVVWLDAASIPSATPTGTALSHWPNHVVGGVTNLTQPDATKRPTFHGSGLGPGLASVHFDGGHETGQELTGSLWLSANRTILWVLKDEGSPTTIASGVVYTWPVAGSSGSTALGGLSTARDSDGTMKVAVDGDGWNMLGFVAPSKLNVSCDSLCFSGSVVYVYRLTGQVLGHNQQDNNRGGCVRTAECQRSRLCRPGQPERQQLRQWIPQGGSNRCECQPS